MSDEEKKEPRTFAMYGKIYQEKDYSKYLVRAVSMSFPPELFDRLVRLANEKSLTPSRLMNIAIDKEMEREDAFEYNLPHIAKEDFKEFEHAKEAEAVFNLLRGFPKGLPYDMIQLSRFKLGIPDRKKVACALKELSQQGMTIGYIFEGKLGRSTVCETRVRLKDSSQFVYGKYKKGEL